MRAERGRIRARSHRGGRYAYVVVGVIATSALTVPVAAISAPDPPEPMLGPTPESTADPQTQQAVDEAMAAVLQADAERRSPDQAAEREASRDDYQDLSPADSADLAAQSFPELIAEPTWQPPELPPGAEIVSYQGTHAALIEPQGADVGIDPPTTSPLGSLPDPGDPGGLLESTLPIRARTESGALRPLDPTLEDHPGYVEPTNATVEAKLPDDLSDQVRLPELGISLRPQGASAAEEAQLIGPDKLFYADIAPDTDFLATPTQLGVETFLQLRSEQSPEEHMLHLDLPQGASLQPTLDGTGAVVKDGSEVIAAVDPPTAFDADGVPVPVAMAVAGDSLRLTADFHGKDFRYPIMVDPAITEPYDFQGNPSSCPTGSGSPGSPYWRWETPYPTQFAKSCTSWFGIVNGGYANRAYAANQYSQWVWGAPPNTFIEKVDWISTDNYWSGASQNIGCTMSGLYDPTPRAGQNNGIYGAWEPGAQRVNCYPWSAQSFTDDVGSYGDLTPGDPQGVDNNVAVWQLYAPSTSVHTVAPYNGVRGANFYLYDRHNPALSSAVPQNQWSDDTSIGGSTHDYTKTLSATDVGLGAKYFWFFSPDPVNPSAAKLVGLTRPCSATRGASPCTAAQGSYTDTAHYSLPEGRNAITAFAFDQVWNASPPQSWDQPIDRTAPQIAPLTGSMADEANKISDTEDYSLTASATDGSEASDASMRSGVKKITFTVDQESEPRFTEEQPCSGPNGSCPLSATWETTEDDLEAGPHTITVAATDMLDHVSTRTLDVTVVSDTERPDVETTITGPDSSGNYVLHTATTDPPVPGEYTSGVTHLEVWIDGDKMASEVNSDCPPPGGCDLNDTRDIGPAGDLEDHDVTVLARDRAGNMTVESKGGGPLKYDYFGYNDHFALYPFYAEKERTKEPPPPPHPVDPIHPYRQMIDDAIAGGSNIIRVQVSWCEVQPTEPAYPTENNYQWHDGEPRAYGTFAYLESQVRAINSQPDGPRIQVIPYLLGTPPWTRPAPPAKYKDCTNTNESDKRDYSPPIPPDSAYIESFRHYVAAFVEQFAKNDLNGIERIEVWNEPNLHQFWGDFEANGDFRDPDPERFAAMVRAASDGVKDAYPGPADPPIDVLPGALSPAGGSLDGDDRGRDDLAEYTRQMLSWLYDNNGRNSIDGISIHLYANKRKNDDGALKLVESQFDGVTQPYDSDRFKPAFGLLGRWITEVGSPGTVPEDNPFKINRNASRGQQFERLLAEFLLFGQKARVRSFIVHRFYDDFVPYEGDPSDDDNGKFGVIPAFSATDAKVTRKGKRIYCVFRRKVRKILSNNVPSARLCG